MGQGQGSITTHQKLEQAPIPGPPFAPTSADNGLSVDPVSGRIVLGGTQLAQSLLLSNRHINMQGFQFTMEDGLNGKFFSIEPGNQFYTMGDGTAGGGNGSRLNIDDSTLRTEFISNMVGRSLLLDQTAGTYQIGDIDGLGPASINMLIDTNNNLTTIGSVVTGLALLLNQGTGFYAMGDTSGITNSTQLQIDDNLGLFNVGNIAGNAIEIDMNGLLYAFGDVNTAGNGMQLTIDSNNRLAQIFDNGIFYMNIDGANGTYSFGEQTNNSIEFDANSSFSRLYLNSSRFLDFNNSVGQYRIGDIDGTGNGIQIFLNDTANRIDFTTAAIAGLRMNGTAGFSGTVTPVVSITVLNGIVTAVT